MILTNTNNYIHYSSLPTLTIFSYSYTKLTFYILLLFIIHTTYTTRNLTILPFHSTSHSFFSYLTHFHHSNKYTTIPLYYPGTTHNLSYTLYNQHSLITQYHSYNKIPFQSTFRFITNSLLLHNLHSQHHFQSTFHSFNCLHL